MVAIASQGGSSFIAFTSFDANDSVRCPHCNTRMPVGDIVAGKFQRRTTAGDVIGGLIAMAVLIGGILLAVRSCS